MDIHVVDMSPELRDSLRDLLESNGHTVRDYDSGQAILNARDQLYGGCILLDCRFPPTDALEVLAGLRHHRVSLPVILMTDGYAMRVSEIVAGHDFLGVLEKPFAYADLAALLEQIP